MSVTAVIGSQWGDEGKGKVVDFLAERMDYVARFNGGNNAGHTVINEYGTFKIHLVPSGIFARNTVGLIGGGVVIGGGPGAGAGRSGQQQSQRFLRWEAGARPRALARSLIRRNRFA